MLPKLNRIFTPQSIAVIGGSERTNSLGQAIFRNLIQAKFSGRLYAINPKYRRVYGFPCLRNIQLVGHPVDLVIIATPQTTVAGLVKECAKAECGGIVILTDGFRAEHTMNREALKQIHRTAEKYQIPILGPDALGVINPHHQLNASYSKSQPKAGRVAFISQSNALCASILRRAESQKLGFSYFVSMEKTINVHLGDLIDFFGTDSRTSSILIYLETLEYAKKFMSAARAFSRSKPILVLKTDSETHQIQLPPIAQMISNDGAFDAAFRRAGIIRVEKLAQLFNCAQALGLQPRPANNRLAILTNAIGPANLAIDRLQKNGGQLAQYTKQEARLLEKSIGAPVVEQGVINLSLHFRPEAFQLSLKSQIHNPLADGVLVILSPFGPTPSTPVVSTIVKTAQKSHKPIFVVLMGEPKDSISKELLDEGKIPVYRFPESAVEVFLYMWRYQRNLELLQETPPTIPERFKPNREAVRAILTKVRSEDRIELTGEESRLMLQCYDLPILPGKVATSPTAARKLAQETGFPAVMKLEGLGIGSKSMLGGVNLSIRTQQQAAEYFQAAKQKLQEEKPEATFLGMRVEPRARHLYELVVVGQHHPLFGPMISFGLGGIAYRVYQDMAVGLPPLTMALAKRIIERTQIFHLLKGYRHLERTDLEAIQFFLYKFAYLLMDHPEIHTLIINPLGIKKSNAQYAIDVKVFLHPVPLKHRKDSYDHLVIPPYPEQYSKTIYLKDGEEVLLRPIKPEDEPLEKQMYELLSKESAYLRFFGFVPKFTHEMLSRFSQIDYDREMAIAALIEDGEQVQMAGVVRIVGDAWNETAEYAIEIADPWQGRGLGGVMTDYILEIGKKMGYRKITASVLAANRGMLAIFEKKGFKIRMEDYDTFYAELPLEDSE